MTTYVLAKRNLDGFLAARLIARASSTRGVNNHNHKFYIAENKHSDIVQCVIDKLSATDKLLVLGMELDRETYILIRSKGTSISTVVATDQHETLSREEAKLIGRVEGINFSACDMIHYMYHSCVYSTKTSEMLLTGCLMRDRIGVFKLTGDRRIQSYVLKGLYESGLYSHLSEDREYSIDELLDSQSRVSVNIGESTNYKVSTKVEIHLNPTEYFVEQKEEALCKGTAITCR